MKKITKKKSVKLGDTTSKTFVGEVVFVADVINPLELDLGREDLNSLVGKLNEVIRKVNK